MTERNEKSKKVIMNLIDSYLPNVIATEFQRLDYETTIRDLCRTAQIEADPMVDYLRQKMGRTQ